MRSAAGMLDRFMRRLLDPPLDRAGRKLARALGRVALAWHAFRDCGDNRR